MEFLKGFKGTYRGKILISFEILENDSKEF
ncbi:hypothetical protein LSS_20900 [Leptospira santarosai serovar Shermani str. LT 821]|uniref:Uncharacterized protein n=1 Tax=Leptospira santarosai serovar Shermani str. LT 821 TaxID=758847 RepID=A0A097ESA8_9LEPT|nr:hypothetical protein LSS_20900 [Leptospira santarosai serovar Shermani str. LT 821]